MSPLYYEASQLNSVHHEMSGRILQNVVVMTVIMGVLLLVALQRSIRISRSITQPLEALCKRAEDVSRGAGKSAQDGTGIASGSDQSSFSL